MRRHMYGRGEGGAGGGGGGGGGKDYASMASNATEPHPHPHPHQHQGQGHGQNHGGGGFRAGREYGGPPNPRYGGNNGASMDRMADEPQEDREKVDNGGGSAVAGAHLQGVGFGSLAAPSPSAGGGSAASNDGSEASRPIGQSSPSSPLPRSHAQSWARDGKDERDGWDARDSEHGRGNPSYRHGGAPPGDRHRGGSGQYPSPGFGHGPGRGGRNIRERRWERDVQPYPRFARGGGTGPGPRPRVPGVPGRPYSSGEPVRDNRGWGEMREWVNRGSDGGGQSSRPFRGRGVPPAGPPPPRGFRPMAQGSPPPKRSMAQGPPPPNRPMTQGPSSRFGPGPPMRHHQHPDDQQSRFSQGSNMPPRVFQGERSPMVPRGAPLGGNRIPGRFSSPHVQRSNRFDKPGEGRGASVDGSGRHAGHGRADLWQPGNDSIEQQGRIPPTAVAGPPSPPSAAADSAQSRGPPDAIPTSIAQSLQSEKLSSPPGQTGQQASLNDMVTEVTVSDRTFLNKPALRECEDNVQLLQSCYNEVSFYAKIIGSRIERLVISHLAHN